MSIKTYNQSGFDQADFVSLKEVEVPANCQEALNNSEVYVELRRFPESGQHVVLFLNPRSTDFVPLAFKIKQSAPDSWDSECYTNNAELAKNIASPFEQIALDFFLETKQYATALN